MLYNCTDVFSRKPWHPPQVLITTETGKAMACHCFPEASRFRGMMSLGSTAVLLLCDKEGPPGKRTSCSRWDCCGWACIWASMLVCWAEPHLSLNPFFIFQVRPVHSALSLALSHVRVALSVFILGSRERRESSSTYRPHGSPLDGPPPLSAFIQGPSCRVRESRSWGPARVECHLDVHDDEMGRPSSVLSCQSFSPAAEQWGLQGPAQMQSQDTKPHQLTASQENPIMVGVWGWGPRPYISRPLLSGFAKELLTSNACRYFAPISGEPGFQGHSGSQTGDLKTVFTMEWPYYGLEWPLLQRLNFCMKYIRGRQTNFASA